MKRESITKADQLHVFNRDNWTCKYCGDPVFFSPTLKLLEDKSPGHGYYQGHGKAGEMLELFRTKCASVDHINPVTKGGMNSFDNYATACMDCNLTLNDAAVENKPSHDKINQDIIDTNWDGLVSLYLKLAPVIDDWVRLIGEEASIEINQKLSIKGPYKWSEVYAALESTEAGIYIWTIPWGEKFLTHYVGLTTISLKNRLQQHEYEYRCGNYRIYDPQKMSQGIRELVWEGLYLPHRKAQKDIFEKEFESKKEHFDKILDDLLGNFRLFLIPIEILPVFENQFRNYINKIEDGIVLNLLENSEVKGFYDDWDIKSHHERKGNPITIEFEGHESIIGLSDTLYIP